MPRPLALRIASLTVAGSFLLMGSPATAAPLAHIPTAQAAAQPHAAKTISLATARAAAAKHPALRYGAGPGNRAVVYVQRRLHVTPAKGKFGPRTLAAVKRYQRRHHLRVTGRVGRATWAILLPAPKPKPKPKPPAPPPANPAANALAFALQQVGKSYISGAVGPDAYDCSGLAQTAYAQVGKTLPRTANQQYLATEHIALADAKPGDLLFYSDAPGRITHVSFLIGDGNVVEAANPQKGVRIREIGWTWYVDRFVSAGRVS
jgi:cell wall-associated NlpC family hydrolase